MERVTTSRADEIVEQRLGVLLRAGVLTAAVIVLAGGIWFLLRHGAGLPAYREFRQASSETLRISAVFSGVLAGRSQDLIRVGLLALIATPVARVILALILFDRQKDYLYVAITGVVLAVIGASIFI